MTLRIRHIDPDATPSSQVSLEALARIVPQTTVAEVLKECNATERRTRKLSAAFVVILCVAMNLYTNDCISHVFFRLLSRVRWLLADPTMASRVSKGALVPGPLPAGSQAPCRSRSRGFAPSLWPNPETVPEAFLFGLRLMALDGTVLDLPDTPENVWRLRQAQLPARNERLAAGEGGRHKRMRHPRGVGGGGVAPRLRRARRRTEAFARGGRRRFVAVGQGIAQLRDGPSRPRSRLGVAGTPAPDGQARSACRDPLGRYAAGVGATLRLRAAQAGRAGAGALDPLHP